MKNFQPACLKQIDELQMPCAFVSPPHMPCAVSRPTGKRGSGRGGFNGEEGAGPKSHYCLRAEFSILPPLSGVQWPLLLRKRLSGTGAPAAGLQCSTDRHGTAIRVGSSPRPRPRPRLRPRPRHRLAATVKAPAHRGPCLDASLPCPPQLCRGRGAPPRCFLTPTAAISLAAAVQTCLTAAFIGPPADSDSEEGMLAPCRPVTVDGGECRVATTAGLRWLTAV
jgi:hypothetical protein